MAVMVYDHIWYLVGFLVAVPVAFFAQIIFLDIFKRD